MNKSTVDTYILLLNSFRSQAESPELSAKEIEEITAQWDKSTKKVRESNVKFVTSSIIIRGFKLP